MARFFARRLAGFAAVLLALSFIIFSLLDLVPGDPVKILVGTRRLTPEVRAAITAQYGLDKPLLLRYWHWLLRALTGDFGNSVRSATPVTDVLAARVGLTTMLTLMAFVLAICVGVPLGIWAARRAGSWVDRSIIGWSVVGISAPGFALGLVLLYVFGLMLGWFPIFGAGEDFMDSLWHLALPAIALATGIGRRGLWIYLPPPPCRGRTQSGLCDFRTLEGSSFAAYHPHVPACGFLTDHYLSWSDLGDSFWLNGLG